jgi:hypothetical protein
MMATTLFLARIPHPQLGTSVPSWEPAVPSWTLFKREVETIGRAKSHHTTCLRVAGEARQHFANKLNIGSIVCFIATPFAFARTSASLCTSEFRVAHCPHVTKDGVIIESVADISARYENGEPTARKAGLNVLHTQASGCVL